MQSFDTLLTNASLIDGTGAPPISADIGIVGDRIAAVGDLSAGAAREFLNASGKVVAPGFVDVHTHDDSAVLTSPDCLAKISQGVTTVVVGNCGVSAAPVTLGEHPPEPLNLLGEQRDFKFRSFADYVSAVGEAPPAVNVAALVGHTSLRIGRVGRLDRPATPSELAAMRADVEASMRGGAIGLSTGLAYANALAAPTEEVLELAGVASEYDGIYTTHLRDEFDGIVGALGEAFRIGETADLPVVISHLKCAGPQNWGRAPEILNHIEQSGLNDRVHMDCYPYAAGSSNLDLGQVDERVKILITRADRHPEAVGKTLAAIAAEWGASQIDAAKRLMPAGAVYFSISEEDMRTILRHDKTMIGSDGLPHDVRPHPRLFGAFSRVLGKLCRDESLLGLHTAIRKMTSLPARVFGFVDRGFVRPGCYADLVVLDPATVGDCATFTAPKRLSAGIEAVYVNGIRAFVDGAPTGNRRGRYLTRSSFD